MTLIVNYFLDPLLRAPTIGCMLMCLSASLVGVIAFLRKESLLGEALSHASYPGVIIGVIIAGTLFHEENNLLPTITMIGAFISALLGIGFLHSLERGVNMHPDSALCFILASFFGIGSTIASFIQFSHASLYRQALGYLWGQAATLTDIHILIYGALSVLITTVIIMLYKELQTVTFDRDYAISIGIKVKLFDTIFFILITVAIVLGIRTVGVVLISGMLIAPAVSARQYSNRLFTVLAIAGGIGFLSGFIGNLFANELTYYLKESAPEKNLSLPTGPMIVIAASIICLFSLLFAPEKGLVSRWIRMLNFRYRRLSENILKSMWRTGPHKTHSLEEINAYHQVSAIFLRFIIFRLRGNGQIEKVKHKWRLTKEGARRGAHIIRLHRLWEAYLADYLEVGANRVHKSAEEMEHIITPELEKELSALLRDPKLDPHHQPIPRPPNVSD